MDCNCIELKELKDAYEDVLFYEDWFRRGFLSRESFEKEVGVYERRLTREVEEGNITEREMDFYCSRCGEYIDSRED